MDGNDYSRFYAFVEQAKAVRLTESTYLFDTKLNQDEFESKLRSVFSKGDNVVYISENNRVGLFFIKI